MTKKTFQTLQDLAACVGQEVAVSDWITVTQEQVNQFAEATGDHQWIHVDVERAKAGPFGGPIAHGFLTLSLVSRILRSAIEPTGLRMAINYGLNRVRFVAPVPEGSRIRGTFTLANIEERGDGQFLMHHNVLVEIEGSDKTALTADWIGLLVL